MNQPYPKTNTTAIIALVFAALGLTQILPVIGSVIGKSMAISAKQEIYVSNGTQIGEDLADLAIQLSNWGVKIFVILVIIFVVMTVLMFVVGVLIPAGFFVALLKSLMR